MLALWLCRCGVAWCRPNIGAQYLLEEGDVAGREGCLQFWRGYEHAAVVRGGSRFGQSFSV